MRNNAMHVNEVSNELPDLVGGGKTLAVAIMMK